MKKLFILSFIIIFVSGLIYIGVALFNKNPILKEKEIISNITKIQISLSYNENPNGKNEAMFITNKDDIQKFITAFYNTNIKEETDIIYGNTSVFRFFSNDILVKEFHFYYRNPIVYINENNCFICEFYGNNPWDLYKTADSDIVFVDNNFNIIP